jgi:hypothetical protein
LLDLPNEFVIPGVGPDRRRFPGADDGCHLIRPGEPVHILVAFAGFADAQRGVLNLFLADGVFPRRVLHDSGDLVELFQPRLRLEVVNQNSNPPGIAGQRDQNRKDQSVDAKE